MTLALGLGYPIAAGYGRPPALSIETHRVQRAFVAAGSPARSQRLADMDRILVKPLVAAGLWSKHDSIYIPQHSAAASRVNLVAPAGTLLTPTNTPTVVTDRYFAGDGATSYFDTGINPSTAGGHYTLNSAAIWVWSLTDSAAATADIGNGTGCRLIGRSVTAQTSRTNTTTGSVTDTFADSLGLYGWSRVASNEAANFRGATLLTPQAVASVAIPSATMRICGAGTLFSARHVAAAGFGAGLTAQNVSDLHAIIGGWLDHIGAI